MSIRKVLGLVLIILAFLAITAGAQTQDPGDPGIQDSVTLGFFFLVNTSGFTSQIVCAPDPIAPDPIPPSAALYIRTDEWLSGIEFRLEIVSVDSGAVQVDSICHFGTNYLLPHMEETFISDGILPDTVIVKRWATDPNDYYKHDYHYDYPRPYAHDMGRLIFTCMSYGKVVIRNLEDGGTRFWLAGSDPTSEDYFIPAFPPWEYDVVPDPTQLVDDPGQPDIISFVDNGIRTEESTPVELHLTNDEAIEGVAMHLVFRSDYSYGSVRFDSVSYAGRLADPSVLDSRWVFPLDHDMSDRVDTLGFFPHRSLGDLLPPGEGAIIYLWFTGLYPGEIQLTIDSWPMQRIWPEGYPVGNDGYFCPEVVPVTINVNGEPPGGTIGDPGESDTVRIANASVGMGESTPITVSLFNDEALANFGLYFELTSLSEGAVVFDSVRWIGRLADPQVMSLRITSASADGALPDTVRVTGSDMISLPLLSGDGSLFELFVTGTTEGQVSVDLCDWVSAGGAAPSSLLSVDNYRILPVVLPAVLDVGEALPPAPVFEPLVLEPTAYTAGAQIEFEVSATSPVGSPVDLALTSMTDYDNPLREPAVAPAFAGSNPGLFQWTSSQQDVGIWLASFEAIDQVTDRVSTATVQIQIVSGSEYLTSFGLTKTSDGPEATGVVHGDFDHDGMPELLISSNPYGPGTSCLSVYDYAGFGILEETYTIDMDLPTGGVATTYFNDDNHLDAIACLGDFLWVLNGNGDNTFALAHNWVARPTGLLKGATLTSFDGDPFMDYACITTTGVTIYMGGPYSNFIQVHSFEAGDVPWSISSADFNQDGWDDLAISTTQGLEIYINDGLLPSGPGLGYTLTYSYSQAYGSLDIDITNEGSDFNNDGIYDLCLASPEVGDEMSSLMIYLGQGDGSFAPNVVRSVRGRIHADRTGDFNGDGQLDIAYINAPERYMAIVFGEGTGEFSNELRYPIPDFPPQQLDCLDIDADGDLDAVVCAYQIEFGETNSSMYLFRNNLDPAGYANSSFRVSALDNANLELHAPNGGRLSQITNSIASGDYYRRNLDGDNQLDASAVIGAVDGGRYDLIITPKPGMATNETFSIGYQLEGQTELQIARDLPNSVDGYTFPVFPGSESPISPKQGSCVRTLRPVFDWRDLYVQTWEKQGSMPVPDLRCEFQLAPTPDFVDILETDTVSEGRYAFRGIMLVDDTVSYFWRVRPLNFEKWDHVFVFHALPASDLPKDPVDIDADDDPDGGDRDDGTDGAVEDPSDGNGIPDSYLLAANYPNPFNPITVVTFGLPAATHVKLDVFNIIGQKVTTLVDEMMPAGYHDVLWNATDMPSGVYFYRLQAADYIETRKMVLLK